MGLTDSRRSFEGESASVFAEGGKLGKLGYSASATGASVGIGVGGGVAAGLATGETTTEPGIQLDRLRKPRLRRWSNAFTRRCRFCGLEAGTSSSA